jgi:hypothetical protein
MATCAFSDKVVFGYCHVICYHHFFVEIFLSFGEDCVIVKFEGGPDWFWI